MGNTAQTQKDEQDPRVLLPNNPFVPPKGDVCFINDLPPELLSHIFEVGLGDTDSEDDDDMEDRWDTSLRHSTTDGSDGQVSVAEVLADGDDDDDDDDEETDDSEATGSSAFSPPWPPFQIVASHVCRHWRNVALATPSLWTTIVVSQEARPPFERVSTMLSRSKGLPIDIYVNCEPDESECDSELSEPSDSDLKILYQLLTPHIHRWRTIEVSVSEYHHMFVFLSAVAGVSAAPQLTTLQLYHHEETEEFDNFGYPSVSEHLVLFGGVAPCLTSVVLWGVHVDWDQPWIASASKLIDLELAFHAEDVRPTWAQLATILRGATSLEKLSLRLSGPSGDPPDWIIEPTPEGPKDLNAPVQLPKVTDFILAFHSQTRAIGLIHKFILPALKNLVLDFDNGEYTELVHVLAGPATSASPIVLSAQDPPRSLLSRLESLKLAGLPCRTEAIATLYGELSNLRSLNLSLAYLEPEFLDLLGTPCTLAGGGVWLPRLTTLYAAGTTGDTLREIVDKRRNAGVPLESLYVEESCDLDGEDVAWLKANLKTFELFEASDDEDEDVVNFEDLHGDDEIDVWSDID